MKVLLVGSYEGGGPRSMERFGRMLIAGLRSGCPEVEVEMIRPRVILGRFFKRRALNKWLGYFDKFVLFPFRLRRAIKARPESLAHILDQGDGILAGWAPGCAVTCHDLLAIRAARGEFPQGRTGWTGRIYQALILRGLRKAGSIAAVSEASRADAARLLGPAELIPNAVEDFWKPMEPEQAQRALADAGVPACDYLLHVGGGAWYKNRAGLIRAYSRFRARNSRQARLVMVGPALDAGSLRELGAAGLAQDVIVLTGAADETLRALYSAARALVFPSIAEGFGLPILEAQACGCPVLISCRQPMLGTGGGAAIPVADEMWPEAMEALLEMTQAQRAQVVRKGLENARRFPVAQWIGRYRHFYETSLAKKCQSEGYVLCPTRLTTDG